MSAASDVITAIAGGGGALAVFGGGFKFVWSKIETRFQAIEAELDQCRGRERASQGRNTIMTIVVELLWQEVKRIDPQAAILDRAQKHMDELKAMNGKEDA